MPPRTPQEPAASAPVPEITDADVGGVVNTEETPDQLRARIAALQAELEKSNAAKDVAEEESARLAAAAQTSLFTTAVVERYAGQSDDGTDMWWYRIDLAPCGGVDIKINGIPYLHGETYKFDTDLLRSVKEIVARTWIHENDIHGHEFNPYRRQQNKVLGSRPAPSWAFN